MTQIGFFVAAMVLGAEPPEYKLTVGPVEEDLAWPVLRTRIDMSGDKYPRLLDEKGSPVAAEVSTSVLTGDEGWYIGWLAPEIKKGTSRSWKVVFVEESEFKSPIHQFRKLPDHPEGHVMKVDLGGKPFTAIIQGGHRPYLQPVLLDGVPLTRQLEFGGGTVDGVDFSGEGGKSGKIVQREVEIRCPVNFGQLIRTRSEWVASDGKNLLVDLRSYGFFDLGPGGRFIDLMVTLTPAEGPRTLGDTSDGYLGILLAEAMKETHGGEIVNSRGGVGLNACRGKPAEWVDCTGKIDEKTYGVAVFDAPDSFRHPTTWNIREDGHLAASPFAPWDFTEDKTKEGFHRLDKDEEIRFHYRVFFHPGTTAEAKVAAAYRAFVKLPLVKVEQLK